MTLVIGDREDFKDKLTYVMAASICMEGAGVLDESEDLTRRMIDAFLDQYDTKPEVPDLPDKEIPGYYDGKPQAFLGFTVVNLMSGNVPPYFVDKVFKTREAAEEEYENWLRVFSILPDTRFDITKVYFDTKQH